MLVEQMTLPETDTKAQTGQSRLLGVPQLRAGSWGARSLSPAYEGGAPHPAPSPELSAWEDALIPCSRPGLRQLLCQSRDRAKPGSDALAPGPVWAWEGAAAQPHLSRPGPWGGVSHLCWSGVRFLTSPGAGCRANGPRPA